MKKKTLSLLLILTMGSIFGQEYYLNLEDSIKLQHLNIDTVSNSFNSWQVGTPQKSIFSSAFSVPNAIVTSLLNPYPIYDTSIFLITNIAEGGFAGPHTAILEGQYYVNSDSLNDYGTIEFSLDKGVTWIDLINTTTYSSYLSWELPKPILTGNSNGWQHFQVFLSELGLLFNTQYGDTLLYRFTFVSDGTQTNKDGLMFDDFHFVDYIEGIDEKFNDNLITIYPNPVSKELTIKRNALCDDYIIQIFDSKGQLVDINTNCIEDIIDIQQLKNGIYLLKYSDTKSFIIRKFIVNH